MNTSQKITEIKKVLETQDVNEIITDKFNGIWFNVDGHEIIALSNEDLSYASNNIVDGDIIEVMPEHELYDNINIFYPY